MHVGLVCCSCGCMLGSFVPEVHEWRMVGVLVWFVEGG
jgi:hypothetical protein